MNERTEHSEFEELLSRMADGSLIEAELQQLGWLLESDALLRRRYLEYCQIHGLLRAEHGLLASWGLPADEGEDSRATPASKVARFWQRRAVLVICSTAAAAVVAIVATGILNLSRSEALLAVENLQPYRGKVVAELQNQLRAAFTYGPNGEESPAAGSGMPQGTYELRSGVVELRSNSGVVLTVEGPATFTLADEQCFRIEDGRVAAHVPKEAAGFRIETASATVVDLGTDFAVEAVSGKSSEVHVFDGEVQINLHGSKTVSARPMHLTTGEAARIDFLTGVPAGIDLDKERFLRRLYIEPRTYTQRVLDMHPAVYYPMEPLGDGAVLRDVTSNGADAKIEFGLATERAWAAGKVGLAFALGGPALQTYASAPRYPQAQGDQMSVVAWVLASSRPRWASIAKNWAGADDRGQFHFGLYFDSGELEAHIEDSSGDEIIVKDKIPLPLNVWHHVAFVADGTMLRLYRNGKEVDAAPYHQLHRHPRITALAIGTKLNLQGDAPDHSDFNMWDGRLDELAIFNHALSAEQIRELYETGAVEN